MKRKENTITKPQKYIQINIILGLMGSFHLFMSRITGNGIYVKNYLNVFNDCKVPTTGLHPRVLTCCGTLGL